MDEYEAWLSLPHDQVTARTLLDLATEFGYSETDVRTSETGYFVPAALVDRLYPTSTPEEG